MNDTFAKNLAKIEELQEFCRFPMLQFMNDCIQLGVPFKIGEAYRTKERQAQLYAQGRTTPGAIVTKTLTSKHTEGLAVDLDPVQGKSGASLRQYLDYLEDIGQKYGIKRPKGTLSFGDYRHFELTDAKPFYVTTSIQAQKRFAERAIKRLSGEQRERAIARYSRQYGAFPSV